MMVVVALTMTRGGGGEGVDYERAGGEEVNDEKITGAV